MPSSAAKPAPKTLSKKEVIEILGKSKRSIETYISTGRLACHYVVGPNGRQAAFERADVERLRRDIETPTFRTVNEPAALMSSNPRAGNIPAPHIRASGDPFAALAAHLAKLTSDVPPLPVPVGQWRTLDEAAEHSGLPKSWLLAQARAGAPFAMNVGTAKKAVWRFRA